ncbi:MAG: hypothetical protein HWN65_04310 [Candidatus Helarchaeota archaeon]|nr:hypothetical protein [Candidatus Helarchaeota archaeon]
MDSRRIEELKSWVQMDPGDSGAWYELGMAHYAEMEWLEAHKCFKTAEIAILNEVGEKLKNMGNMESSQIYFQRAQNVENKPFKLAPGGSSWLRNLLIVTGAIALVCLPFVFTIPFPWNIFGVVVLLFDLLVILILLPIAIVKSTSSRKREPTQFSNKIKYIEDQMEAIQQVPQLDDDQKFIQLGKLKRNRARTAQELVRCAYTRSLER